MEHVFRPRGVCSHEMRVEIEDGIIRKVAVKGGCSGNLQGISKLLVGMDAREAISRMRLSLIHISTTSLLFIVIAVIFGYFVYRRGAKVGPATVIGVIGIIVITFIGLNVGINLPRTPWIIFIAVYITAASLLPVWILLQPRDYLSSFLLYGMMILALVGVLGGSWNSEFELEAFTGWQSSSGYLFPALFITVACGAISGFHSLVASGTSSKQINSEKDAKVIGYGAMIVECILAILSLIAAATVWHLSLIHI